MGQTMLIAAELYLFACVPARCTLLIIDMQRHFIEQGLPASLGAIGLGSLLVAIPSAASCSKPVSFLSGRGI